MADLIYVDIEYREITGRPGRAGTPAVADVTGGGALVDIAANFVATGQARETTDARGYAALQLLHQPGGVYRISIAGVTGHLHCDTWSPGDRVPFTAIIDQPGGDTQVEYVTLTTVIASIDSKVASAVEDYLAANPPADEGVADLISTAAGPLTQAALADFVTEVGQGRYSTIDVVADFGADPTGATASTEAFNDAIAKANLTGSVVINLPPGTYYLPNGLTTPITRNYVWIIGAGMGASRVRVNAGTCFQWGNATLKPIGGGIAHLDVFAISQPNVNQRTVFIKRGSSQKFRYIMLDGIAQFAQLGSLENVNDSAGAPGFRHIYGGTWSLPDVTVIDCVRGASLALSDIVVSANVAAFPSGRTELHQAATGNTFLRFGKAGWDTVQIYNVTTNRYDVGLDITVAPGAVVASIWSYGAVFDYCKSAGLRMIADHAGSYIGSSVFTGGWLVATDGHAFEMYQGRVDGGVIRNIDFVAVSAQQSGKGNWYFSASLKTNVRGIRLLNCRGESGNRLEGNTSYDAADLAILADGIEVTGGRYGDPHSGNLYRPDYGVMTAPNAVVRVRDVTGWGSVGAFSIGANTVADARSLVTGNRNAASATSKPEYAVPTTEPVVGSTIVQTQIQPTVDTIYIYGGTVSAIEHNGVQVGTSGPAALTLHPGDTWRVTFTVPPTIRRVVAP